MKNKSKLSTAIGRHSLIATALACAFTMLGGIAPKMVWAQAGSTTSQVKKCAEGDRLMSVGDGAYLQGK